MKAVLATEAFKVAVIAALDFIPSRPSHPVLACFDIKIKAEGGKAGNGELTIKAYDLSKSIEIKVPCTSCDQDFQFCVAAKTMSNYVSKLDDGSEMGLELFDVKIDADPAMFLREKLEGDGSDKQDKSKDEREDMMSSEVLTITTSTGASIDFVLMSPEFYPALPSPSDQEFVPFSLKEILTCAYCASDEDAKGTMKSVQILQYAKGVKVTSTDSHRMASSASTLEVLSGKDEYTNETLLPSEMVKSIVKATAASSSAIEFAANNEQAFFKSESFLISCRLMAGNYPNCEVLIPKEFNHVIELNRKGLIKTLNRIKILADQSNSIIGMQFEDRVLTISTEAWGVGAANEKIPVMYDGDSLSIFFNVNYLVEMFEHVSDDVVLMKIVQPFRPVMVYANGGLDRFLLMPIKGREGLTKAKYTKLKKEGKSKVKAKPKQESSTGGFNYEEEIDFG